MSSIAGPVHMYTVVPQVSSSRVSELSLPQRYLKILFLSDKKVTETCGDMDHSFELPRA